MSQNIYDTPEFFTNYSNLLRSRQGLDGAPEWPRMQTFLPSLPGSRIIDLGCGFGWYTRWFHERGAASVHALDISQNMLDRAREMTPPESYSAVIYLRADLDDADIPLLSDAVDSSVDMVFSSLALHYLVHLERLVAQVYRVLKPGGVFVFSVEHPIVTAPAVPGMIHAHIPNPMRAGEGEVRRKIWPLYDYQAEGLRVTDWLADGVHKQHRTVTTYINLLLGAGFVLTGFDEWCPMEGELDVRPEWVDLREKEMLKPTFLLVQATKMVV
ncbi:S-adenosyl-L-methionine-dependent methyltransferase [Podospora appendiculata]|uniref:S-adenosyl-L-methionine-dependent methyltransferase n=1 Tax=Podospora appendiculata TaxID=314037 RepID=A0AAE1CCX6_9PEZI|nr:S-adenosyl-L-methionine-dependent methyltransferase [Podospora appendiculata]